MNTAILKSFLTVVQYKSFTQASQVLQVTQPTISNHMATLEELYGVALFQRNGKSVMLTSAGRAFIAVAERLLAAHDESIKEMAVFNNVNPLLRIGTTAQSAVYKMGKAVQEFRKVYPQVCTSVKTHYSLEELVSAIKNREVDFGFINFDTQPLYMNRERLWEEKLHFIVSRELYKEHNCSNNIYDYPLIAYTDHGVVGKVLGLNVDFSKFQLISESNDSLTILHGVADGVGVALVPQNRLDFYKKIHEDVVVFDGPGLEGTGIYSLIYDFEMDMTPAKKYFLECVKATKEV